MNREMRRSGLFEADDEFYPIESINDIVNKNRWDKILNETERPENEHGVIIYFLIGFIKPEMRDAFREIAISYFRNRSERDYELHIPEIHIGEAREPFEYISLAAILLDAYQGDSYAKDIILSLYKTFYKKEYNLLKRVDILSADTSLEPSGTNKLCTDDELNAQYAARVIVMSELLGKDMDSAWFYEMGILNRKIIHSETIWRTIRASAFIEEVVSVDQSRRRKYSEFLTEHFPEVLSKEQYKDRFDILPLAENAAELGIEQYGMDKSIIGEEFDLYESLLSSMVEVPDEKDIDSVILIAYIYHLGQRLGEERKKNRDIYKRLIGLEEENIIPDEVISENGIITDTEMAAYQDSLKEQKNSDHMSEKVLAAIGRLSPSTITETKTEEKEETTGSDLEQRLAKCEQELRDVKAKNKSLTQLYAELKERNRALEEKNRTLSDQIVRIKSDEKKPAPSAAIEVSAEEIDVTPLTSIKGAIIGGPVSWQNKLKERLPEWVFISVDDSVSEVRDNISGADAVFLYTDVMSHTMYYRVMSEIRKRGMRFYHLHGVNVEKVLRSMVESIEGSE